MAETYKELVRELEQEGVIHSPRVRDAMLAVDRAWFLPPDAPGTAAEDAPVPIRYGQTISQPRTVAYMLELLQPQEGDRVLDVGAGSGWTAALLAWLVGPKGRVYAVERIPQLHRLAVENLDAAGIKGVEVVGGDGSGGLAPHAPYDVIHVGAAAKKFPAKLAEQLAPGGRLVVPVGESVQEMVRAQRTDSGIERTYHGMFSFVPLIEG